MQCKATRAKMGHAEDAIAQAIKGLGLIEVGKETNAVVLRRHVRRE